MAQEEYKCIKCGFAASRGFVADYSDGANFVAKWIEGALGTDARLALSLDGVEARRWTLKVGRSSFLGVKGSNIEIGGRRQFSVRSLRCERCGFLELYAV